VLTHSATSVPHVAHTVDPTDLLTLPALLVSYWLSDVAPKAGRPD
jgi:hypothetical protein